MRAQTDYFPIFYTVSPWITIHLKDVRVGSKKKTGEEILILIASKPIPSYLYTLK